MRVAGRAEGDRRRAGQRARRSAPTRGRGRRAARRRRARRRRDRPSPRPGCSRRARGRARPARRRSGRSAAVAGASSAEASATVGVGVVGSGSAADEQPASSSSSQSAGRAGAPAPVEPSSGRHHSPRRSGRASFRPWWICAFTVPRGTPMQLRDVLVGHAVDVAQQQRLDVLRVVLLDRLHRLEQVEAGAGDDRGGARVGPVVVAALEVGGHGLVLHLAVGRAGAVERDDVHPGGEAALAVPRADLGGDVEQRLLAGVLGVAGVGQDAPADVERAGSYGAQQPLQGVAIAVAGAPREVIDVVRSHACNIMQVCLHPLGSVATPCAVASARVRSRPSGSPTTSSSTRPSRSRCWPTTGPRTCTRGSASSRRAASSARSSRPTSCPSTTPASCPTRAPSWSCRTPTRARSQTGWSSSR